MNYGQALVLLKSGKKVRSSTAIYSLRGGLFFMFNEIGLRTWIVIDPIDIINKTFEEYK
jgi:hypothetical protein